MDINSRIDKLRKLMLKYDLDAYIINTSDPHNSEYLADTYKTREWISGFTGSAGLALVTLKDAILWTDGRYFIQAEKEIKNNEFKLYKMNTPGYPNYVEYLKNTLDSGSKIGLNGEVFSQRDFEKLSESLSKKNVKFKTDLDLINIIWDDRPEKPNTEVFIHDIKYTGKSAKEKINEVRNLMDKDQVDYFLVSTLDDIAWLYNIRARDVKNNPVLISYAAVSKDSAYLFTDTSRINDEVKIFLRENNIKLREYIQIYEYIESIDQKSKVYVEKDRFNRLAYSKLDRNIKVKDGINYTTILKAIKNDVEIKNQKNAYIKDGVALTKFIYWLDTNIGKKKITELSAQEKLLSFRKEQSNFIEPSFDTISAYKENAAMMHYSADENSNKELLAEGLYLVDSGGQYLDGTTDITRTIVLGDITEEEKRDFTLTFKGHTNLITSRFLEGSTGYYLDVLARMPLWKYGIDYKCGTGHGIGYMLNVHEGPHRIAFNMNEEVLRPGMITSIEPGVYKSGKHGIRLENIVVVVEDLKNESGQFYKFEPLSYVPIDIRGLDIEMLTEEEKAWLNSYHSKTYELLSPYLTKDESNWLKKYTKSI